MKPSEQEVARLMAVKAAVVATTNSQGWVYIKQMSENIVKKTIQEALDEEDSSKGESKRLKASALQKGFASLFEAVEATTNLNFQAADDSGFGELEMEQAVNID